MAIHNLGRMLQRLSSEYQHAKQVNVSIGGADSEQRRHHGRTEQSLQSDFERLVTRWVKDPALQQAWRNHFYHFAPAPTGPELEEPPLFKGRGPTGQTAELRHTEGAFELFVDGQPVRRFPETLHLSDHALRALHVDGMDFSESFESPETAQAQLTDFYNNPEASNLPWAYATELYSDGLIDPDFGLTQRGKRLIDARRGGGDTELTL